MALLNLTKILSVAQQHKFAVGAFNAIDSNFIDAVFSAAIKAQSPVIINVAEVHLSYMDLDATAEYIKKKAELSHLPVCLNLDHGLTFSTIEKAIKCGFSSIMFDGSALPYAENLRQTKQVVELCHELGISVEAELGAVGGDEDGALESIADTALYTPVEQAREFVQATGIDALAVAIGNTHGKYKGVPKLDLERLAKIRDAVQIPLVLHGGSGLSNQDFQQAILRGICKINFFTGMSQAALASLSHDIQSEQLIDKYNYYLLMTNNMQKAIAMTVEEQMAIFASVSKAALYG